MKTSDDNSIKINSSRRDLEKTEKNKNKGNKSFSLFIMNNLKTYNDYEINILLYEEALKVDKRSYCQYYLSLIKRKQLIIFIFFVKDDYNLKIIKISLFSFSFALYYTVNCLFFTDSAMHKIYEDKGKYNFIYQIPQIFYSSVISFAIDTIANFFSLTEKNILEVKNEEIDKKEKGKKTLNWIYIKFGIFFSINYLLLIFFWYYLGCFCAVYKNTQYHLLKDTLISFGISLLYPFGLNLLPGIFRIPSLKVKDKNKECMYNFSKFLQFI